MANRHITITGLTDQLFEAKLVYASVYTNIAIAALSKRARIKVFAIADLGNAPVQNFY
jgi:hypothetical protein